MFILKHCCPTVWKVQDMLHTYERREIHSWDVWKPEETTWENWHRSQDMQSDSGRKISILAGDDSVGHCEKRVHMNMCLNGYWDRHVWICSPNSARFLFLCLDKERCLKNNDRHTRWVAHSDFVCCCMHRETRRSTQTNNTRSSHTSCRMHYGLWIFKHLLWTVNKLAISV